MPGREGHGAGRARRRSLARARLIFPACSALEWPRGFSWPPGAVPVESCHGRPRRARLTSQTPTSQQSAIRTRGRLESRKRVRRRKLRTHDRDREHEDHEQALEPEHERGGARRQRRLRTHRHVEHHEDDGLDRDPAEDVPDRDPEVVRERRRGRDRDLRQVRRDREQDRAAERLAEPEPDVERVGRARELDPRDPDRHGRNGEDQDERGEAQTREHELFLAGPSAGKLRIEP